MLNKLLTIIRRYDMVQPGDSVTVAVSGGADSIALLFGMYLLSKKLQITVSAAHFNHHLRGAESDRDENFVRDFCAQYDIPFCMGSGTIIPGRKGLEAAAREARYAFLQSFSGKVATAHTADDNAETVLMHMVRGTGLKGLGGITPVRDRLIRPMLSVTRKEVLGFLREYHLSFVEDSSNGTDRFLRNRLRHHVMPLLEQENPRLAENLSAMALRLRDDEEALAAAAQTDAQCDIETLRQLPVSRRSRALAVFLENSGVREPEAEHIALLEELVFSQRPSAKACFPGGITIARNYGKLVLREEEEPLQTVLLPCPGSVMLPLLQLKVICRPAEKYSDAQDCFTVRSCGPVFIRHRLSGDAMRLNGGTKSLKKLFVDRKIPASRRLRIPVIADDIGVVGVYGFGPNRDRLAAEQPAIEIRFEPMDTSVML